jgi:hypothetical protein
MTPDVFDQIIGYLRHIEATVGGSQDDSAIVDLQTQVISLRRDFKQQIAAVRTDVTRLRTKKKAKSMSANRSTAHAVVGVAPRWPRGGAHDGHFPSPPSRSDLCEAWDCTAEQASVLDTPPRRQAWHQWLAQGGTTQGFFSECGRVLDILTDGLTWALCGWHEILANPFDRATAEVRR